MWSETRGFEKEFGTEGRWFPARIDAAAVEQSFLHHIKIHRKSKEKVESPSEGELSKAILNIEKELSYLKFKEKEKWDSYEAYLDAVKQIDMNSIPGEELKQFGSTNQQVFKWDGVACDEDRLLMVYQYVLARLNHLEDEPAAGPIKVFIKQEEHKKSKVDEGRWRLISSVSLVDTLVDRMLFPGLYDRTVSGAYSGSPIAVGWSFLRGGYSYVTDQIVKPLAVDMSSWDWTVQEWMVRAWHDIFSRLNVCPSERWRRIWLHRVKALFKSTFHLPSGTILKQKHYGIVKSGSWFTLVGNSILQLLVDEVISARFPGTCSGFRFMMGDDTLKEDHDIPDSVYLAELEKLGLVAKMCVRAFEFCGFKLDEVLPLYKERHIWRLDHCYPEVYAETLQSYRLLYHKSPDEEFKRFLLEKLSEEDPAMVWSKHYLDNLVEGYEPC